MEAVQLEADELTRPRYPPTAFNAKTETPHARHEQNGAITFGPKATAV